LVPATAEAVREAEGLVGFPLPPLLRRLYLEVADGGFGPYCGLLGLAAGHSHNGLTALDLYRHAHEISPLPLYPDWWFLPYRLLPLCEWGCGIYSFIDCSDPRGPMWGWDAKTGAEGEHALFPEPFVFTRLSWLCGEVFPGQAEDADFFGCRLVRARSARTRAQATKMRSSVAGARAAKGRVAPPSTSVMVLTWA
jgi:hypothetical protein